MKRRKGIRFDYNLDGTRPQERVKGFWKRYWRRWLRRHNTQHQIQDTTP